MAGSGAHTSYPRQDSTVKCYLKARCCQLIWEALIPGHLWLSVDGLQHDLEKKKYSVAAPSFAK